MGTPTKLSLVAYRRSMIASGMSVRTSIKPAARALAERSGTRRTAPDALLDTVGRDALLDTVGRAGDTRAVTGRRSRPRRAVVAGKSSTAWDITAPVTGCWAEPSGSRCTHVLLSRPVRR